MTYAEASLLWAMLGFLAGFGAGWLYHHWHARRTGMHVHLSRGAFGVLLLLIAVAMVVQNYVYQRQRSDMVACQVDYNLAITYALQQRFTWAGEDRAALHNLINSVFTDDDDRAQQEAYRQWVQVTSANERAREANPLPPLPPGRCGL